jgi:hypothetical protein
MRVVLRAAPAAHVHLEVGHIHLIHRLDDKVNHIVSGNPVAKVGREKKPLIPVTGDKLFTHGPDYIMALLFSIVYSHKFMDFSR